MRHHRNATRLVNQLDGIFGRHFSLRNPSGLANFKEAIKRLIQSIAKPFLHERTSHVRSAWRATTREREYFFSFKRDANLVQTRHHFANAILAYFLELS